MKNHLLGSVVLALILSGSIGSKAAAEEDAEQRWLEVYNNSSNPLCEIYITNVASDVWQANRIRSCIQPHHYRTVDPGWQIGYCKMNMKFIFEDGSIYVEEDYNICIEDQFHLGDEALESGLSEEEVVWPHMFDH